MRPRFDLTIVLTYYAPHLSGLTEVARTVAEGLAARGWRVAVVASRHESRLPRHETRNGVEVFRAPVLARIGRGVLCPTLPTLAGRVARDSAVVNLHLPMLEAGVVARLAGATPLVCNHHDDVWLPGGLTARTQVAVVDRSVLTALRRSAAVVVNNIDHGEHSRHWSVMERRAVHPVAPPCVDRTDGAPTMREGAGPHVGFLGRIAAEKGLQYLVAGFRRVPDPDARLLLAGDHSAVAGGSVVDRLRAEAGDDQRIRILGRLTDRQVADLYASIDVFALTSVAEESFGIVQAEAMMAGVPVVASDLPGMRVPVRETGFGRLVPPRDPSAIAEAITEVGTMAAARRADGARRAKARFGGEMSVDGYEAVFRAAAGDRLAARLR
ncbi:MAG: glycosyltransferase family 4 protein [Dactylosporangium sp.]|nr:glycosyltransferase family 4 protein [Dactylosporangium sp.]NNJ60563.1 glycosyltransferase family 4 protein [Dactylosporangium sp.]